MKKIFPTLTALRTLSITLLTTLAISLLCLTSCTHQGQSIPDASPHASSPIIILHTNDVHGGIDDNIGYAGLAAYKNALEEIYGPDNIILVDAGDAIQGSSVAMLTKGESIVSLMNAVGYDYFALGNHEFDYQLPQLFALDDKIQATILSANFINLETSKPVYAPYAIHSVKDLEIAFIGITTPETILRGNSIFFQDADGHYLYTMQEDPTGQAFYNCIQATIDQARADGADFVVAVAHLGIEDIAKPWRSTDLIAHTSGLDLVLDGHSHSIINSEVHKDLYNSDVILAQTGSKLKYIGQITIDPSNTTSPITATLLDESTIPFPKDTNGTLIKDPTVQALTDTINSQFAKLLAQNIAYNNHDLIAYYPDEHTIRLKETNLGNLVADAYRTLLDSDIAIASAGGIRTNLMQGDVTYQEIIDLHPFGNYIMSVMATGAQIRDALEMGVKLLPDPDSALIHPSGLTYTIDLSIPSSVQLDDRGNFLSVAGPYRVRNILVNNEPLDLNRLYSVASHDYLIKRGGDGLTMFQSTPPLKDMFMLDNEVLINYITKHLNAHITAPYDKPQGRMAIVE